MACEHIYKTIYLGYTHFYVLCMQRMKEVNSDHNWNISMQYCMKLDVNIWNDTWFTISIFPRVFQILLFYK